MADKDAYYFSHDSNARHDPKIVKMLTKYEYGYQWYFMIIEILREQSDYKYKMDEFSYGALARELHIDKKTVEEFVSDCCTVFDLFKSTNEYFWSNSLLARMRKKDKVSRLRRQAGSMGGRIRGQRLADAKKKGTHTKQEWQEMKDFFGVCVKCNGASGLVNLDADHIIPLYQGGSDSITNIQPLCAKCNASKSGETVDYRPIFCQANAKQMPSKWLALKESKGKKKESKVFTPPTLQDVKDFFALKGYTEQSATTAFNHYDLANWHDTEGKPVKNWKQKMNTVWFKPENKIPPEEDKNWK